jgi:hypothetical protein
MLNTFDTSHVVLGLYCTGLMLKYPFITLEIKFDLLHEATPKYGTVCISILLWVFGDINPLLRKTDFIAAVLSGSNLSLIEDFRKTLVTSSPPAGEKGPTSSMICVGENGFFGKRNYN